jgi:hypothetical protein
MATRGWTVLAAAAMGAALGACGGDDGPSASFESPSDGEAVAGGVAFELAADGVTIEEAGEARDGAGHFHVVAAGGCVEEGEAIARDADHVHLGRGQADGVVFLGPGEHELCVQVGDGEHVATDITDTVTVDVGIGDLESWCAVVGEVDERFLEVDTAGGAFAEQQIGYEGIRRLLEQLIDGLEHVDAAARDDVAGALNMARTIATVFVESADVEEAGERLQPIFAGEDRFAPAEPWILDNCGIDIDD